MFTFSGADASVAGRLNVTNISGDTSAASAAFSEGSRTSAISRVACQVRRDEALLHVPAREQSPLPPVTAGGAIGGSTPSQVQSQNRVQGKRKKRPAAAGSCHFYFNFIYF